MEILIIVLAMVCAAAFSIALITLNKYNSYHEILNNMRNTADKTQEHYEVVLKELAAAREAMQVLVDNDNAQQQTITDLAGTVQNLSLAKINQLPNNMGRNFKPQRHGDE